MKTGDSCQVRAAGGDWIDARVSLASANGRSLALECDQTLGVAEGFAVDVRSGKVMLMLLGDDHGQWIDIANGCVCEVKERD